MPSQNPEALRLASLPERAMAVSNARLTAGLTLQAVADRIGTSVQYVCHAEAGRSPLSAKQESRILAAVAELAEERDRG